MPGYFCIPTMSSVNNLFSESRYIYYIILTLAASWGTCVLNTFNWMKGHEQLINNISVSPLIIEDRDFPLVGEHVSLLHSVFNCYTEFRKWLSCILLYSMRPPRRQPTQGFFLWNISWCNESLQVLFIMESYMSKNCIKRLRRIEKSLVYILQFV